MTSFAFFFGVKIFTHFLTLTTAVDLNMNIDDAANEPEPEQPQSASELQPEPEPEQQTLETDPQAPPESQLELAEQEPQQLEQPEPEPAELDLDLMEEGELAAVANDEALESAPPPDIDLDEEDDAGELLDVEMNVEEEEAAATTAMQIADEEETAAAADEAIEMALEEDAMQPSLVAEIEEHKKAIERANERANIAELSIGNLNVERLRLSTELTATNGAFVFLINCKLCITYCRGIGRDEVESWRTTKLENRCSKRAKRRPRATSNVRGSIKYCSQLFQGVYILA